MLIVSICRAIRALSDHQARRQLVTHHHEMNLIWFRGPHGTCEDSKDPLLRRWVHIRAVSVTTDAHLLLFMVCDMRRLRTRDCY